MEVLRAGRRKVSLIRYAKDGERRLKEILDSAEKKGIRLQPTGNKELGNLVKGAVHQGVVADVSPPSFHELASFTAMVKASGEKPVIAILDSISDPHNFGAILRSAEVLGVAGVIFPKDRSADINSTVIKTSAGATEYLEFCKVTNIARTIDELKKDEFWVIAADADGEHDLKSFDPTYPLAIVLGSEGEGVRPLVKKGCDAVVRIPQKGKVSSLNVSSAAALLFYELAGR